MKLIKTKKENKMNIKELKSLDLKSYINCLNAFSMLENEYIEEYGFNENSGYVWLYLENGITICSTLGRNVEYLVYNYDTEEEVFFNTYSEALASL